MNHEMILGTCSFKYKQAASYQPLPPVSHQNVCEGTEKSQGWHCSKDRLQLNSLRIFTKYRAGQRGKKWWQYLPHPLYRTSHFSRRKARRVFSNLCFLHLRSSETAMLSDRHFRIPGGCLLQSPEDHSPQHNRFYIHPKTTHHRKESREFGSRRERERRGWSGEV